jgi:Eukaryotic cytochrome b561
MKAHLLSWLMAYFVVDDRIFHIVCHVCGIICAILGLVAIAKYKSMSSLPIIYPFYSMYSPHSWMAVAFLILWGIQLSIGLVSHTPAREKLSPNQSGPLAHVHRFLGKSVYVVGLAVAALGFQVRRRLHCLISVPWNGSHDCTFPALVRHMPVHTCRRSAASCCSVGCQVTHSATQASFLDRQGIKMELRMGVGATSLV